MKRNYWMMMLCLLAGGIAGCSDDDNGPSWKELFDKEQATIKEFVKDKSPLKVFEYDVEYSSGKFVKDYAYLFGHDSTGVTPKVGQFILVNYTQRTLSGDILDSTYPSVAGGAKVTPYFELGGPVYFRINDNDKILDPTSEAWKLMSEGTKGDIILSSLMTNSTTYLYREYEMEKIIQNESLLAYENELISNYISEMPVSADDIIEIPANETNAHDTIAKLVMLERGTGETVMSTDSVTLWLEGEILDEINTTLRKFVKMQEGSTTVKMKVSDLPTKGLRMALITMKEGDKAKLFLPSGMAYGYGGGWNNLTNQCTVPPYSTLMFTIEINKTERTPTKN